MPSAYVDGGGHMVAIGPIKSTLTSTTSTKLGVTKMPWGCCFILCVLARKYCPMFEKTEPLIWTSVTGTLSRDRSDLRQGNWSIKANVTFEGQQIQFSGQNIS